MFGVKLKRTFPAALEYMSMTLPIWPKAYRERVGADAYSHAPVGTGPYKITKVDGVSEIDLERNDAYFDGPEGPPGRSASCMIHEVADATTEITEILSGRADWIWQFNPDQFENISRVPALQAVRAESMRIGYLQLDAAGRTGADNPLTKVKVRQAIAHAIDRATIARQLVQGGSRVLDARLLPDPVRLRPGGRHPVRLRPGGGEEAAGRGGLPGRVRHRAGDLRAAAV